MDPIALVGTALFFAALIAPTAWANRHLARQSNEEVARLRQRRANDEARSIGLEAVTETLWRKQEGDRQIELTIIPAAGNPKSSWNTARVEGRVLPVQAIARTTVRIEARDDDLLDFKFDVQIGDAELDPAHTIGGSDRVEVARLVGHPTVRAVLRAHLVPLQTPLTIEFKLAAGRQVHTSRLGRVVLDDGGLMVQWNRRVTDQMGFKEQAQAMIHVLRALADALDEAHAALPPPRIDAKNDSEAVSSSGSPVAIRTR